MKPIGRVVDMRHYIDEETDDLPASLADRIVNLAGFFGAIVAWVTDHVPLGDWQTNVPCRRSPGRRRCRGEIIAELDRESGYIVWQCPICGDNAMIHGWEPRRATPPGQSIVSTSPSRSQLSTVMGGPLARLAFYLLEPRSDDRLANWNFLDDALGPEEKVYPIVRSVK